MKRWKKKKDRATEGETPTPAIDALIGDEEQTGKKEETESGSPTQISWTIQSPPTTLIDHTVGLF